MEVYTVFTTEGTALATQPIVTLENTLSSNLAFRQASQLEQEGHQLVERKPSRWGNGVYATLGNLRVHERWDERADARMAAPWVAIMFQRGELVATWILDGPKEVVDWLNADPHGEEPVFVGEEFGAFSFFRIVGRRQFLVVRALMSQRGRRY